VCVESSSQTDGGFVGRFVFTYFAEALASCCTRVLANGTAPGMEAAHAALVKAVPQLAAVDPRVLAAVVVVLG